MTEIEKVQTSPASEEAERLNAEMPCRWEVITPDEARNILDNCNHRNPRALDQSAAGKYAFLMEKRLWDHNSATVSFHEDGSLADGQTRLRACVLSGIPLVTLVVRGLPTAENVDAGRKRSATQVLKARGEKNVCGLCSAISVLYRWEKLRINWGSVGMIPTGEYIRMLGAYPTIRGDVEFADRRLRKELGHHGLLAAFRFIFSVKDREKAKWFFDKLATGAGMEEGCPVLALRSILIEDRRSRAKRSTIDLSALIIKAWNHVRHGTSCYSLKWIASGPKPEPFPMIE